MNDNLLRPEEAAKKLGISKSFLYQLIRQGLLIAVRIGSSVRLRQKDLDEFIAGNLTRDDSPDGSPAQ